MAVSGGSTVLSLVDIANEFADRNDNRKRNFVFLRNKVTVEPR